MITTKITRIKYYIIIFNVSFFQIFFIDLRFDLLTLKAKKFDKLSIVHRSSILIKKKSVVSVIV